MQSVGTKNTGPEMIVRRFLHRLGYRLTPPARLPSERQQPREAIMGEKPPEESGDALKGWVVHISGETGDGGGDKITVIRRDPPQIRLEIDAPGIRSAGEDQKDRGRRVIQDAVTALQEALDSPSALPGLRQQ